MRDSEHFSSTCRRSAKCCRRGPAAAPCREQVANKMQEWFESGLQQWDISRDAPYFGFREFPTRRANMFLRLAGRADQLPWAPSRTCATSAATPPASTNTGRKIPRPSCITLSAKTLSTSTACSGPAMLEGSSFRKPTNLFVHGYVTVNSAKMSQVARHLCQGQHLVKSFRCRQPALLLHRQALFTHR